MKRALAVAGLILVISLAGCATSREQHVVSQDGVPVYCTTGPGQDDGDCDPDQVDAAIKSAPVWYKVENNTRPAPPFDPGPIPNFGR
jgi:hypothetical protein